MSSLLYLALLSYLFITISFIINMSHFLLSLLCLEGMMLSLMIFTPHTMMSMSVPGAPFILIMLTFSACEASLGLSVLVKMSRHYGSDTLSNLSINKC